MLTVPFINYQQKLSTEHDHLKKMLLECATSSEFILKKQVIELESALKKQLDMPFAYAVSNGTFGLYLSLISLGIKKGDEIITPAFSYISTASVISQLGAIPVFVDVNPDTYLLNHETIANKITSRTKAIMAVHLFSGLVDMSAMQNIARMNNLFLVEDSAVTLGATINNVPTGTMGDIGVFSFFPAKPLGGIGDGGLVVTRNEQYAKKVFQLRNHGQDGITRFLHHTLGFNSRMDEINAKFLLHRLDKFSANKQRRREIAHLYCSGLHKLDPFVRVQNYDPDCSANYACVIRAKRRDSLQKFLKVAGIETKIYYPEALPYQPVFNYLKHKRGEFPHAEQIASEALALPICETLTDLQIEIVISRIEEFYYG